MDKRTQDTGRFNGPERRLQANKGRALGLMLMAGHKVISDGPQLIVGKQGRLWRYSDINDKFYEIPDDSLAKPKPAAYDWNGAH